MTDKEKAISELQQWLRNIQKSQGDEPAIIPDGIFSEEVRLVVEDFQRNNGLEVTGIVDFLTWEALKNADRLITKERALPNQIAPIKNSDLPLKKGMDNRFTDVLILMLHNVAEKYTNFNFIEEDGFGDKAEEEVIRWQAVAFLEQTGEVDKETWNSLSSFYLLK